MTKNIRVRAVRRKEPDLRKLARLLIRQVRAKNADSPRPQAKPKDAA